MTDYVEWGWDTARNKVARAYIHNEVLEYTFDYERRAYAKAAARLSIPVKMQKVRTKNEKNRARLDSRNEGISGRAKRKTSGGQ